MYLDRCCIGDEGGVALARCLQQCPSLMQFHARNNLIGDQVQAALRQVAKGVRVKLRLKEL